MIHLLPNGEQIQIVDTVRGFLADRLDVGRFRKGATECDHAAWGDLAELGCFGMSVPEKAGGTGLSLADDALVFREFGRAAATPSLLATWVAIRVALAQEETAMTEALVAGRKRAAMAVARGPVSVGAVVEGDLNVLDPEGADVVVVMSGQGVALLGVQALTMTPKKSVDWTMPVSGARVENAEALCHAEDAGISAGLEILAAAMAVGLAEAARDLAVGYARVREQFGQPIGGFQAIKHMCADMEVRCESAWAQTIYAALATGAGEASAGFDTHAARILATRAAIDNGEGCIQVHGGIGFTAESNAHVFLKRAQTLARIGKSVRRHQRDMLGLPLPGAGVPA